MPSIRKATEKTFCSLSAAVHSLLVQHYAIKIKGSSGRKRSEKVVSPQRQASNTNLVACSGDQSGIKQTSGSIVRTHHHLVHSLISLSHGADCQHPQWSLVETEALGD